MKRQHLIATVLAAIGFLSVLNCSPAWAHHSYAMFDRTKTRVMSGTVRTFEWTNPHAYLWVNAFDKKGRVVTWAFEFIAGVNTIARQGWTRNTLKPGEKVTITYYPLKDGRTGGEFKSVVLPGGAVWTSRGPVPRSG